MKTITSLPLGAFILACAFLAPQPASAQFSTPMRDVENPARYPAFSTCVINYNNVQPCEAPFGPAGKQVVITTVSLSCKSTDTTVRFYNAVLYLDNTNRLRLPMSQPLI